MKTIQCKNTGWYFSKKMFIPFYFYFDPINLPAIPEFFGCTYF